LIRGEKILSSALPTLPFIHHIAQGLGYFTADPRLEVAIEAANVLRVPIVPIDDGGASQLGTMPIHFYSGYFGSGE